MKKGDVTALWDKNYYPLTQAATSEELPHCSLLRVSELFLREQQWAEKELFNYFLSINAIII